MFTTNRIQRAAQYAVLAAAALAAVAIASPSTKADQLQKPTVDAFDRYNRTKETSASQELAGRKIFLSIDSLPQGLRSEAYASLKQGQILMQPSAECDDCTSVSGGLIHDWTGIVFIPGASLSEVLSLLQDYDRDAAYYQPEVVKSKLLSHSGDDFQVYLRLKQVQIITVVLDTEYDIRYTHLDASHAYSRSYSTRIAEVDNVGEPNERDLPVGNDRGFLWRLYSYWRFYEGDGGVYLQCNAVSLTRDVPLGLGSLVRPFLETIPSDSLRFTLDATRKALENGIKNRPESSPLERNSH